MRTMQHTFKIFWQPERRRALSLKKGVRERDPSRAQRLTLYSMSFIGRMNERLRMVKKELEQMENAE